MEPRRRSQNGQHVVPEKAIDTNVRGVIPSSRISTQAALLTCGARGENRAHEFLHLLYFQGPWAVRAVLCCGDAVFKFPRTPVHPEVLKPSARIPFAKRVQMTSSRVRLGQSFKTVGCGCTSCWGDVGAGSVEADVFYIPFIVSVQYIGY